jgi:EAL domain-containing protein (putative c-di-GMP-specific phosphodiesterase class I)
MKKAVALPMLWRLGINFIQGYFLQPPSANLDYDFTALS